MIVLVARLIVAPFLAAAGLTWAVIGPMSEEGGSDQLVSLTVVEDHGLAIGVLALLLVIAVALDIFANWRHRASSVVVVGWSVALGVWVGALGRLITARTTGANIGGSFILIVSAVIVPAMTVSITTKMLKAVAIGSDRPPN